MEESSDKFLTWSWREENSFSKMGDGFIEVASLM